MMVQGERLNFPQQLRHLRRHRGFTQAKLASLSGLSRVTISHIEQGRNISHVTINTLVRLSKALGVTTDALLGGFTQTSMSPPSIELSAHTENQGQTIFTRSPQYSLSTSTSLLMQEPPSYDFLMGFSAALGTKEVAYTICQRVDISETIIDGRIIAATPAAERLFERDDLHTGTVWQSETQPLSSFRNGWKLSLARREDHQIPSRYITQIVNLRGEPINVIKSTIEVLQNSYRFWITRLELASTDPNTPDVNKIVEDFRDFEECQRALCIAEIHRLIRNLF